MIISIIYRQKTHKIVNKHRPNYYYNVFPAWTLFYKLVKRSDDNHCHNATFNMFHGSYCQYILVFDENFKDKSNHWSSIWTPNNAELKTSTLFNTISHIKPLRTISIKNVTLSFWFIYMNIINLMYNWFILRWTNKLKNLSYRTLSNAFDASSARG